MVVEGSLLEWALGALLAVGGFVGVRVHRRLDRIEERQNGFATREDLESRFARIIEKLDEHDEKREQARAENSQRRRELYDRIDELARDMAFMKGERAREKCAPCAPRAP